ncbi:MAG: AAA family ATPase [Candidatus Jordarchaeales archaeon]
MVIIEELELENFVSHKKTKVKFDLGVTLIVGPNGAGKTSILDGISFALFKLHSRGKDENIVNKRARHAKVSLKFSVPGRGRYIAEWDIERKKEGCNVKGVVYEVTDGGRKPITREAGSKTLLPEIARIVGIEKETFESSIYVRQGEIEKLVTEKPAERKKLISKLLGIEDFEQAWRVMEEIVREYREKLAKLRGMLEEKERVSRELEEVREKVARVRERIGEVREIVRKLKEEKEKAEEKLRKIEDVKRRFDGLRIRLAEAKADLKDKESKVDSIKEKLEKLETLKSKIERSKAGYERYSELEKEIERIEEEKRDYEGARDAVKICEKELENRRKKEKRLEDSVKDLMARCAGIFGAELSMEEIPVASKREKERVEREIKALNERHSELVALAGELDGRMKDVEEKIRKLKEAEARCPLCGRELTKEHKEKLLSELTELVTRLEEEKKVVEREIEKAKRELEEKYEKRRSLEGVDVEAQSLRSSLDEVRRERGEIEAKLEEAKVKLEKLIELERMIEEKEAEAEKFKEDYDVYMEAKSQLKLIGDEEELMEAYRVAVSDVEKARIEVSNIEKEIDALGYSEEEYNRVKGEVDEVGAKLEEKKMELAKLEGEERQLSDRVEKLEERIRELREKEAEAKKLEAFVNLLEKVRGAYGKDGIQKLIRSRAKPLIEKYTKEYLNRFNLEYSDVKLDDDYEITVIGPSGSQSVDAVSGGERVALAIALRMAIAKVIAEGKVSTMIMDEPTVFLDEERRRELIEILKKAFKEEAKIIPQLIIVSHDRELEDAADVVYMVTKEGGWSKVEQVEWT